MVSGFPRLFLYLIYRGVMACFTIVSEILLIISGKKQGFHDAHRVNGPDLCRIGRVITRFRYTVTDYARPVDFLVFYGLPLQVSMLLSPSWSLYTMDEKYVYLVLTSGKTEFDYTARKVPFIYMQQYEDAGWVAKVPILAFVRLLGQLPELQPKLVFVANQPRAGTTLFSTLVQVNEKVFSLSEPDIFTHLYRLQHLLEPAVQVHLLKAVVRYLCRDMTADETCIIKGQSWATNIAENVTEAKILFLARRNMEKALISCEKMMGTGVSLARFEAFLAEYFPGAAYWLTGCTSMEMTSATCMHPYDTLDSAFYTFVKPLAYYEHTKDRVDYFLVEFEKLMADPEKEVSRILSEIGIDDALLPTALEAMSRDSQKGTVLSQDSLKGVQTTALNDDRKKFFNQVCTDVFGIQPLFSI